MDSLISIALRLNLALPMMGSLYRAGYKRNESGLSMGVGDQGRPSSSCLRASELIIGTPLTRFFVIS
jgi:hypothetical protein